ncbi:nuak family kinase 1 isoform X1 [Osmia lignaria lignaria]|uniref:nuak family kinase 1 isoform X1 n=1 Tax=Osmia lignaria lignaria TaxID=1437193 RepID=UPI00402B5669
MVVGEASIHNIMGGMESTGGVRLHNHKRKLKQRFDIIKKLGQGTYGKVQLGINKETGQEVAIKTIKKCKIETEADLIRIRREIQIMSSVQHPNIIHIYEVFENREKMVLVMEYAAGGELYDYLSERKKLTEQEARRIFRQIATAVFYCHKHKICHRDLKLENILLDQVGNAKIADFGLSNVFDEQRLLNTFCGSPLYASPEIVKGTPYHGPEVDCWSLGVLLYTLVYGAMPFDGSNFKRLVKQISQSDYYEPKKPSPASPLIKDMLTVRRCKRADIEKICTHWWVNEGYEQNCLDIAEELAAQTPVRLDLLLSLVPQSASAEKLVVGDQQTAGDVPNDMSSENLVPTRCHSVGSLMELDQNNSDRRIRELLEEEPRTAPITGEAKRKLETTPSMDETAAAGAKRKERSRKKEKPEEREPRTYKSASRHHSAPIPNAITEEAMEVDPTVTVPINPSVDLDTVESSAACLELIKECNERFPSKERSETPVDARNEAEKKSSKPDEAQMVDEAANATPAQPTTPVSESVTVSDRNDASASNDAINLEATQREFKKLKEKALSLDSELSSETSDVPGKTFERRRSKIFETAEKFNQMASNVDNEKPKKIFIPGVNVGGAKRVFERKASLSSASTPPPTKPSASKIIIDVPTDAKKNEKVKQEPEGQAEEEKKNEDAKKRAVDIITGAIGKPPVQKRANGSPPTSPPSQEPKKLPLKIPVGTNDLRSATVSVSTPVETKFPFEDKESDRNKRATISTSVSGSANAESSNVDDSQDEPKMSSKMEITLKSATLPRPRKTTKAEISLSSTKPQEIPVAFKSEVEAKIDAFQPQKLRTQRSEVAFPVAAAVPQANRSSSLEPEGRPRSTAPKERIIPIQVETGNQQTEHSSTPPPSKLPPMPQRSISQRSGSLSRQSTADSDTDSALGSTVGPEPIRKSPREYIIPIAVEGGGYVTPRSGSVEPESKTSTPTSANAPRSRFGRPRRMSSLLSDASEDESPFSTLHRDSEDLLQRHMHRLRSSRPSRQPPEHADSLSSGEDDDDDGFELLTAENLFSTLLSRVRSLTQRLNVDDNRTTGFPRSRLFDRLGSNPSQAFWGLNKPLSSYQTYVETRTVTTRLSESQFRHSLSREGDVFSRKDPVNSSNPATPKTPNSPGSHGTPSRETVFDSGNVTLPRDKVERQDVEAEPARVRKETQESLEQSFTPSLARRLSRTLIEQDTGTGSRSPYETRCGSPTGETSSLLDASEAADRSVSTVSDQTEYRQGAGSRSGVRRANSLLERSIERLGSRRESPRRSVSLFEGNGDREYGSEDRYAEGDDFAGFSKRTATGLDKWYKDAAGKRNANKLRRESFRSYRTDKIQEETGDGDKLECNADNGSISECTSASVCDSNTNLLDATTSSVSAKSYESSSTESNPSSNLLDYKSSAAYKSAELSRNFENRLLAAENLIKESKLKNLVPTGEASKFDRNLSSSYRDTDKCEKRSLISIGETLPATISKRRSCIPSLRLRSGSLTREPSSSVVDRRKSFADSLGVGLAARSVSPEKSLLSKLFKGSGNRENEAKEKEKEKEKTQKCKQRRISRFLRPDFFDTPREESQYAKEKEAQKAAENERRKSRFMRRKTENGAVVARESSVEQEKQREKELKNEINSLKRDSRLSRDAEESFEVKKNGDATEESSKNGFLHSLEKKLEKLRSNEQSEQSEQSEEKKMAGSNATMNGRVANDNAREHSAPPAESSSKERSSTKRAVSVEDLSSKKKTGQNSSRSRVSSVLGLFKSGDAKQPARSQNAILSKLKRSPPKATKADASLAEDTVSTTSTSTSASRIPTKLAKCDSKATKKIADTKKTDRGEKMVSSDKKSPTKEAPRAISAKEKRASSEKESKEKMVDREVEEKDSTAGETVEKRSLMTKAKKTTRTSAESGSAVDADKKVKRLVKKPGENSEGDSEGTKKKKIVRVAKKIVKKSSDTSEDKTMTEEKEKSGKIRAKKKTVTRSEMNSGESNGSDSVASNGKAKENGIETLDRNETAEETRNEQQKSQESQRPNRSNLKLDLSKIPQHSFRNSTPKKDSPKSESPKVSPKSTGNDPVPDKLMECLSKVTHRASITGNKIVIDKPLRAKDVAELKREVTECAKIIESHAQSEPVSQPVDREIVTEEVESKRTAPEAITPAVPINDSMEKAQTPKESITPIDYMNELFSPVDEPESFDSWSISSTELNHARPDLHSPTSPSRFLYAKSDNPDSVIERIRRRSFYSRFNDKRRPSLTAPPPGLSLPTSATLPRKFSFSGHREHRDRGSKYAGTGLGLMSNSRHTGDRSYSLYGDEGVALGRNRSLDRSRYSDTSPYVSDLKSPTEHLPTLSSSYDPLRRYLRSPTFDLSASRSRYHSADFADPDLPAYRTPPHLSSLLLNDHAIDTHATSSSSSSLGSSTLPRKYGSTHAEPKTIQYYEELLAPSSVDYLTSARRSPLSSEYLNRCENGYYNGNLEAQSTDAKRKPMMEFTDQSTEQIRSKTERARSPSTTTEAGTVPTDDHS